MGNSTPHSMIMKTIVSFSGGKDSTWMLLEMMRRGERIDEVIFFDTGWEFPQMSEHVNKIERLLNDTNIHLTRLHPEKPFDYWMFDHKKRNGEKGFSWCGLNNCRWGTYLKTSAIKKYLSKQGDYVMCVGIASDETHRIDRNQNAKHRLPLVEWGITEAECLQGCYSLGYDWGGLYEQLDRVSCKFCSMKNLKELRNIYFNIPSVWKELREYQTKTDMPYKGKGKSVFDLEVRFELEKEFIQQGKSIRTREFFNKLK